MASELALVNSANIVEFDDSKIALLKSQIAPECSNDELELFIAVCKRTGLDPFARQIYAIPRKVKDSRGNWTNKMSIQTSIDGFRLIAERTGKWEGMTAPLWCGPDGQWIDVWLSETPPSAAKVGVFKKGFREPVTRVALWKEYAQTYYEKKSNSKKLVPMWLSMPSHMLAKTAESLALRASFPNDLSGLYTKEEMNVVEVEAVPVQEPNPVINLVQALVQFCQLEDIPIGKIAGSNGLPRKPSEYSIEQYKQLSRLVDSYGSSQQEEVQIQEVFEVEEVKVDPAA